MSILRVQKIRHTGSNTDVIDIASDGTCRANITNNLSNRNKVINGSMVCSQRGTTFSPSGTDQIYTLDRFQHVTTGGADGDCTVSQSTDVPNGFSNSYKVTPDATNTPTGGGNVTIRHKIEGQDCQDFAFGTSAAKSLIVSFYAKTATANSGDQYTLCSFYHSSGTTKSFTVAFTPTSTWQRFSFVIAGDTNAGQDIVNTNSTGINLIWVLASGPDDIKAAMSTWTADGGYFRAVTGQSNFMDNTSNEFYLTGVQLEVDHTGSGKPTDYEHRSFAQELALCQRYFYKTYNQATALGTNTSVGAFMFSLPVSQNYAAMPSVRYPVTMRVAPSVTAYSTTNANTTGVMSADSNDKTTTIHQIGENGHFPFVNNSSSGISVNVFLRHHFTADAEL